MPIGRIAHVYTVFAQCLHRVCAVFTQCLHSVYAMFVQCLSSVYASTCMFTHVYACLLMSQAVFARVCTKFAQSLCSVYAVFAPCLSSIRSVFAQIRLCLRSVCSDIMFTQVYATFMQCLRKVYSGLHRAVFVRAMRSSA